MLGFSAVSYQGQSVLLHLVRKGQRLLSAFDSSGCGCCTGPVGGQPSPPGPATLPSPPGGGTQAGLGKCGGSASNAGLVELRRGDKVWVELPDGYGIHNAHYHNYASFYGFLLYPSPLTTPPGGLPDD